MSKDLSLTYYAWFVMVQGKKRHGGCTHARTMEEAALIAAKHCKLTLRTDSLGTDWMLGDKKASLAVWAVPENFITSSILHVVVEDTTEEASN